MVLRWLAAPLVLTLPSAPHGPPGLTAPQAPLLPPTELRVKPPQRFDRSLESLERNQIITPQERRTLERGAVAQPIDVPRFQKACRSGALSKRECATGVSFRRRSNRASSGQTNRHLAPIAVPVSALLAGAGHGFSLESIFSVSPRPLAIAGNGDQRLLFPIIGSAITTSEFGMRQHPIIGRWLMHAGKDLAAPEGTPVIAALSGTVMSSGLAGGYGIAVELEHKSPKRRTLYGHLSEIYVKAGQKVQQGEVIGRVGSTGLSTGPHLHFELRTKQGNGWIAKDPGELDLNPITTSGTDAISLLVGQLMNRLKRDKV